MGVEPVVDEAEMRLRTQMGTGEIEDEEFKVSLNIDSGAVFVEFSDGPRLMYRTEDMVKEAYRAAFENGYEEDDSHGGE